MSLTDITPRLRVYKTLSHPVDPAMVVGFEARNTALGHDAIVLKAEEVPVVREAPAVTHFIVPEEQARAVIEDGCHLYVLDGHTVYHATPHVVEDGPAHTGRKYGENVTGRKVPVEEMQTWPRGAVEVTN